jgi:methylmalonyl-CoA mutase
MNLFEEFTPHTYQQWVDQVTRELKGKPLDSLTTFTADGLPIKPMYTGEHPVGSQPVKSANGWVLVEECTVEDATEANQQILNSLKNGTNGLLLYVYDDVNLEVLLKDVLMQHIHIHFVVEGDGKKVLANWLKLAADQSIDAEKLQGSINIDPIEAAARQGFWKVDAATDVAEVALIAAQAPQNIRTLCVNNNLFANAGATPAQQLGIALAHMHEYILATDTNQGFWLNMAIGSQYFEEIAKFRAIRRLWQQLQVAYNLQPVPLHLYAETGMRNKTIYDPWVNMLRSTTEAMSAALGGADEILVRAYDSTFQHPQTLGERVARNQQLVLAYESYLDRVTDPAAGSYFIEQLTEQLAAKGWEFFKEIENQGGLVQAIENNWLQQKINESHQAEQALFDSGKLNLLGSNIYPNKNEKMKGEIQQAAFSQKRIAEAPFLQVIASRLSEGYETARLGNE